MAVAAQAVRGGANLSSARTACAALGDRTSADLEFGNAEDTFVQLGAVTELDRLTALTNRPVEGTVAPTPAEGTPTLSAREREVLAHLAAGRTNREIAGELVVSVKTVEYHLRNAFQKLGIARRRELAARLAAFPTTA